MTVWVCAVLLGAAMAVPAITVLAYLFDTPRHDLDRAVARHGCDHGSGVDVSRRGIGVGPS